MRRRTLIGGGLAVLLATGCSWPVIPKRPRPQAAEAAGWIRHLDGRYTLFVPCAEMGQHIGTALRQVAAEELGVPPQQIALVLPRTADIARVRATVGSESVQDFALPLARACATLREALAAGRTDGLLAVDEQAPVRFLRTGARWVGRDAPIAHGVALMRGESLFAADVRLPQMRYGRVLRAPLSPALASAPQAFDEPAARAVPGFVRLVRDPLLRQGESEGLGIVAETPGALDRIADALAVRWQQAAAPEARPFDIDARLAAGGALRHSVAGDAVDGAGAWDVSLRLDIPAAAHGAIEPRAAVARFDAEGRLEVWAGSQDLFYQRDVLCRRLGLADDRVVVHAMRVGGGFGGRTLCTVELEAAVLARAAGVPVKVQWTRAQELAQGFHRPPSSHCVQVRLARGRIDTWWHAFESSHIFFTNAGLPPWMQRLTEVVSDGGVARGALPPYRAARRRVEFDAVRTPLLTGPWRGLGAGPNAMAIECAMDEAARVARADPVRFRLDHIEDARLARVLQQVAQSAGWGATVPAAPAGTRRGRGVACGIYKERSYAAVVAEVEVDLATGAWRATRLWCAHDCGRVILPAQVRAQCEGNLVWGLGMVRSDRLALADGAVDARNFGDAPIPRLTDVPAMEVALVDAGEPPSGAGETAIVAAGAAVLNALRAAGVARIERLPVERVAVTG